MLAASFIAPAAEASMVSVSEVHAQPGRGLEGDRHRDAFASRFLCVLCVLCVPRELNCTLLPLVLRIVGTFLLWCILFILCWPLALLALLLYPIVWLLLLPFRILGVAVDGVLALLRAIFMLPARLLSGPRAL